MPDAQTRIQLCGRLSIELDGEHAEARLRGRQGRLLFAYLVLNRDRPVRRDELAESLWTDSGSAKGDADLAPPLSRLRKALGDGRLEGRSDLSLVLPDDAWIDWEVAQSRVREAGDAIAAGDWQTAAAAAAEALQVSEGGLLPGLEAEWIDTHRNVLEELRLDALEAQALAGARLGTGLAAAARAAREVVAAAPFRESARVALIETLRAEGNTAEALRAYEDVRVFLRDELGTNPGPALAELHEQLLREEDGRPPAAQPAPKRSVRRGPPKASAQLADRDNELAQIHDALDAALAGDGGVLVIEGPAGIGKSRLLAELRNAGDGALVLAAKAGQMETDFAFGVVRQLFESVSADTALREQALAGAASAARPLVMGDQGDEGSADAGFAMLHGLYWATLNLAAQQPLIIAIDDLHWTDPASLRFVAYLARRLEGLPILLVITVRSGETPTDETLFNEVVRDPSVVVVRPGPLGAETVATIVRERLGEDAEDVFCQACLETTRGNPLLLRQLISGLISDNVKPDRAHADMVRAIGSRAISSAVLLRLGRLSPEAGKVGRALAVLGEGPAVKVLAQLAEVDERQVATAARELAGAEIADSGPPLGFVHPLVEEAVYGALSATERDVEHTRAAEILHAAGAPDEQIAGHLIQTSPRGEEWAVGVLTRAGAAAQRQGALLRAIGHYRRALEEGVEVEGRKELMLELAMAETRSNADPGFRRLHEAIEAMPDPVDRVPGAAMLYMAHAMVGDPAAGSKIALETAALLPEGSDPRRALEAFAYNDYLWAVRPFEPLDAELRAMRDGIEDTGPGARITEAIVANHWSYTDGTAEEVTALARRALTPQMLELDDGYNWVTAMIVLIVADAEDSLSLWEPVVTKAYRGGSIVNFAGLRMFTGHALTHRGEITDAVTLITDTMVDIRSWGFGGPVMQYWYSFQAWALLEQGDIKLARETLDNVPLIDDGSEGARNWRNITVELLAAEGRDEELIEVADYADSKHPHVQNPAYKSWMLRRIEALGRLGRTDEAIAQGEAVLGRARQFGASGVVGESLRALGVVRGGAKGMVELEESVEVLEGSTARLELARSLAALGTAMHAEGRSDEGLELLQRAHELARILGAGFAAKQIAVELRAAGGTPSKRDPKGVEALSYYERRTAELLGLGSSPQEIADATFSTPLTVARRLEAVERKLGTGDPAEIDAVLRRDSAALPG